MYKGKIISSIIIFLILQGIVVLFLFLQFIPSWELFEIFSVLIIELTSIIITTILVRNIWFSTTKPGNEKLRFSLSLIAGVITGSVIFATSFFTVFIFHNSDGLFSEQLREEYSFPKYNARIYLYDSSFLKPQLTIKYHQGYLPFMHDLKTKTGWHAENVKMKENFPLVHLIYNKDTITVDLNNGKLSGMDSSIVKN